MDCESVRLMIRVILFNTSICFPSFSGKGKDRGKPVVRDKQCPCEGRRGSFQLNVYRR